MLDERTSLSQTGPEPSRDATGRGGLSDPLLDHTAIASDKGVMSIRSVLSSRNRK